MKTWLTLIVLGMGSALLISQSRAGEGEWKQLFNGKDLAGWKTHPESPGNWKVVDGCIVGTGADKNPSHLYSEKGDYKNFHYRIEAKISDKGNSGQYFRTQFMKGYPKGYEAQINSTHSDPVRTGSLYNLVKIMERLHEPDVWFTQEVIAKGNHIQILVNGKKVVDFVDEKKSFSEGHFAIQQHPPIKDGPPSIVTVKKVEVKILPD
jgi:hypothetical protein